MAPAVGEPAGTDPLQAQALVYHHAFGIIKSMALKCAVDLGIPDIIHAHGRPVALSELEAELQMDGVVKGGGALRRLMRLLVHMGCFSSLTAVGHGRTDGDEGEGEASYGLTAFSRLLVKGDNPGSSSWFLNASLSPAALSVWSLLGAWFKADQPTPFHMAFGKSMWRVAAEDPAHNEHLNESMAADSRLVADVVVRECGDAFRGVRSLVDVGGGIGSTARAIAAAFPGLECTVFDLPHVVAAAPEEAAAGVSFAGGDMFDRIPPADAVLLKCVLHDWGDEDCVKILRRCREAIPPKECGGKVIVIDIVVDSHLQDDPELTEAQYFFDIAMMVTAGGKERDEREWRKIFADAGFTGYEIKYKLGLRSLIEAYPA